MGEIPMWPGWPYTMAFRELHSRDDFVPPPAGFASWDLYWALILKGEGMTLFASPGTVPRGKRVNMVFTRIGEDVATCGMHFTRVDGSAIADWLDGDYATIEGLLGAMWASLKPKYDPSIAIDRFTWHDFGVDVRRPNPAVRDVTAGDTAGTADADAQLPPQVAVSVTFKTGRRKTWGRVFLPAPVVGEVHAGRLVDPDTYRTAFGTLLDGAAAASLPLVIWSPRRSGGPLQYGTAHHLAGDDNPDSSSFAMTVDQVQVDDLFDVMESRRYDKALVKSTHTLGG